jgi:hypothetical protein
MSEIKVVKPYPLHEVPGDIDPKTKKRAASTWHQLLMLPEQIGMKGSPDAVQLFCIGCKVLVLVTDEQYQQAKVAAESEGVGAIIKGHVTAGALSDEERAWMCAAHRLNGRAPHLGTTAKEKESIAAMVFTLSGLGLCDSATATLTDAGAVLAATIAAPPVPDLLPVDPKWAAKYAADLKKKAAKESKPARVKAPIETAPMVCVCEHKVADHMTTHGDKNPCGVTGCKCHGYRQAKPPKPAKKTKVTPAETVPS